MSKIEFTHFMMIKLLRFRKTCAATPGLILVQAVELQFEHSVPTINGGKK